MFCKEARARAHTLALGAACATRCWPQRDRARSSSLALPHHVRGSPVLPCTADVSPHSLSLAPFSLAPPSAPALAAFVRSRYSQVMSSLSSARSWQVYSRRCARSYIVFTYAHRRARERSRTQIVYALCMKPNKYKRVTHRTRPGRESERRIKRRGGGDRGRRVAERSSLARVCVCMCVCVRAQGARIEIKST